MDLHNFLSLVGLSKCCVYVISPKHFSAIKLLNPARLCVVYLYHSCLVSITFSKSSLLIMLLLTCSVHSILACRTTFMWPGDKTFHKIVKSMTHKTFLDKNQTREMTNTKICINKKWIKTGKMIKAVIVKSHRK